MLKSQYKQFSTTLGNSNGTPSIFVNGIPRFLNTGYLAKAKYETFASMGSGIYLIGDHSFKVTSKGEIETDNLFSTIDDIIAKEEGALFIIRFFPPAPSWWLNKYPEDELRFDFETDVNIKNEERNSFERDASWGSDRWLKTASGWVKEYVQAFHLRYRGRVIGYQFGMGSHGENNPIGACDSEGRWFCSDFSPAMENYFRQWLTARYENNQELQSAWGRKDVTLLSAKVPGRLERLRTDWFTFRNPKKRESADYYEAFADRVQTCVIRLCEAIKSGCNNQSLAGSHLGGLMDNGYHGYLYHQTCINKVHRALAHPAVDLFTSPTSYENSCPGGDSNSMMPVGSYALHGKMIYQDQDSRTSLVSDSYRQSFTLTPICKNMRETWDLLKRDFAHLLIRGQGLWWHPMVPGMYDSPEIAELLAKLHSIGEKSMSLPRGIADNSIGIIVDEESGFHQECANRLLFPMLFYQRQYCWNRSGAAWNTYLHNDLNHPKMPNHKLWFFLNTFYLTDEEIDVIEEKVKGSGATVIWTYAPGIQGPDGISLKRTEKLTGFKLKSADIQALPRISLTNHNHPLVRFTPPIDGDCYIHNGRMPSAFGTGPMGNDERERVLGPIIYVDDPDATVLGELDCLQKPGFCVKEMDGWTSVYLAAPMLNQWILRNIAKEAGIHIYSESNDVVLPGKSFIMIHANDAGEKVIKLPAPCDVYECFDGVSIGEKITEIRDILPEFGTKLYFLGNEDQWKNVPSIQGRK